MRLILNFFCTLIFFTSIGIFGQEKKPDAPTKDLMPLFQQVLSEIEANYVEETSKEKLMEAAISGILSSLDPHCAYVNPKDFIEFNERAKGEIIGIGMEFIQENGIIKVIAPVEDAPAAVAGLKSGDYIFKINGEAVLGMTTDEAIKKLRGGGIGSEVTVSIYRPGKDPFDLKIKRDVIKVKTVKYRLEDEVGYIRISSFMSEKTTDMVKEAIDSFKKILGHKLKGIVLDLRNNAGGQIEQAVGLCNIFLDNAEIVSTRGRGAHKDVQHYMAEAGQYVDPKLPVVVLINGGSASASEIVAGALQDNKRAIIMGTKSFGKASVQTLKPVMGDRGIKYTIGRYYTPLGRSIQAQGITPDIIVDYMKFEKISDEGRFREKDYKGALKADPGLSEILQEKKKTETLKDNKTQEVKSTDKNPEDQDYQLLRSIELIKSLSIYSAVLALPNISQEKVLSGTDVTKMMTHRIEEATKSSPISENLEWKKYITPFVTDVNKPILTVILNSLGMKEELTKKAILETTKNIVLAFSPYSPNLKNLCKQARESKHEILLSLFLEPNNYPQENPGPKTLLTRQTDIENLNRLNWVLDQGEQYLGLINTNGDSFSEKEKSMGLLGNTLKGKKIPYVDGTPTNFSQTAFRNTQSPYGVIDEKIHEAASQEEIEKSFANVMALAKKNGSSIILVPPTPSIFRKLIDLEMVLNNAGIELAPISYTFLNQKGS